MVRPEFIRIAVIASPHGVRGHVKIHTFTDNPESVFDYGVLSDATGQREFKLTRHGIKERLLIASIQGITGRNEAERLKGTELFAHLQPDTPEEGKWSIASLTGLEARTLDGNVYGRVINVYNFGAGDILDIETGHGKSEMLPFNDDFIGGVHIDEGYLLVFPPDYLQVR